MKKLLRQRPLLIGIALLALVGFLLAIVFHRDPLCAVRADGKEIRILKWEIAEESEYDLRSRWDHAKLWLSTKTPLGKIWPKYFPVDHHYIPLLQFAYSERKKTLFVWYSISEKGEKLRHAGQAGGGIALPRKDIKLIDHQGTIYYTGWKSYYKGSQVEVARFTAINATAPRFQFLVRDTSTRDSTNWFRFTLDNPSPQPPTPALPSTTPLPVQQDLGVCTIQLKALSRSSYNPPYSVEPDFHFERGGKAADDLFIINSWEVADFDGGREGNVSPQAAEWIIRGTVIAKDFSVIPPHRKQAELLDPPPPLSSQPMPFMNDKDGKTRAWLIGPGAYIFTQNGVLQQADLNEAKSLEEPFENYFKDYSRSGKSGDRTSPETLFWKQRIPHGQHPGILLVEAVKPTLLILPDASVPPHSTLFLTNHSSNWQCISPPLPRSSVSSEVHVWSPRSSLIKNEWFVTEIDWPDWDKNPTPQNIEFGLSEAIPFELRFIPSEQMRREVPRMEWQ